MSSEMPWRLRAITTAAQRVGWSRGLLAERVAEARKAGHTWGEIGDALGITRQLAFYRFGGKSKAHDESPQ